MAKAKLSSDEATRILRLLLARLEQSAASGRGQSERAAWRVRCQTYSPGADVLPPSSGGSCPGLVVQGHVAAYCEDPVGDPRPSQGRILLVLTPGQAFGPSTSLASRLVGTTLRALTSCEIWYVCPADAAASPEDRHPRTGVPPRWYRVSLAALWLAIALAVSLILSLPASRSALAVVPLALGEWCDQRQASSCAEDAWQIAAALAPNDADPWLALGTLYAGQGNLGAAEGALQSASRLAPNSSEAFNDLGVVLASLGEYEQATSAFRRALALDPGAGVVELNLGLAHLALNQTAEAAAAFEQALTTTQNAALRDEVRRLLVDLKK